MAEAGKRTIQAGGEQIDSKNKIGGEFKVQQSAEFLKERLALFEQLYKEQQELLSKAPKNPIKITLKDGKEIEGVSYQTTPYELASKISKKLAENSMVAKVIYLKKEKSPFESAVADYDPDEEQGEKKLSKEFELVDMTRPLEGDCKLELLNFQDPEGKMTFWHSSAHILGESLELEYGCNLCIGPPLENGFYYDSYIGNNKITPTDFEKIEKCAKKCASEKQEFQRLVLSKAKALELFKANPFKVQLIQSKIPENGLTTVYRCGSLIDLCTGPHLPSSKLIKAFKIQKVSGSYWLGNKDCDSLQRVYGITFPSQKELEEYLKMQEYLLKNDHRNVGKQYDLFRFDDLAPGSCFFFPHGAKIYNKLIEIIRYEYLVRGYQEVVSPNMYDIKLWEISGHLAKYRDNLFLLKADEKSEQTFGMKPMNCPGHCVMFGMQARSYRDLPWRLADFGVLHRRELSGALSGLTRVYRFQQDDAHIYCRTDQIMEEVLGVLDFVFYIYNMFGFEYKLTLATRPPNRIGDEELWDKAEAALEQALKKIGKPYQINEGDGAFYGPKIDIQLFDVFKRAHQLGTVQCDFNMPIRFNLQYKTEEKTKEEDAEQKKINEEEKKKQVEEQKEKKEKKKKGEKKKEEEKAVVEEEKLEPHGKVKPGYDRPVMIHRAILGSVERFSLFFTIFKRMTAIICEQTGGKWPFFVSPRQIMICPISEKFVPYGQKIYHRLLLEGYQVEIDQSQATLNKKVRNAQLSQFNYIACVGQQEEQNGTIDLRDRDKSERIGQFTILELLEFFKTLEPKRSAYYDKCLAASLADDREEDRLNEELKLKMFFEGMKPGPKDDEWFEKYKEKKINEKIYPNIQRWRNCMKFMKESK